MPRSHRHIDEDWIPAQYAQFQLAAQAFPIHLTPAQALQNQIAEEISPEEMAYCYSHMNSTPNSPKIKELRQRMKATVRQYLQDNDIDDPEVLFGIACYWADRTWNDPLWTTENWKHNLQPWDIWCIEEMNPSSWLQG